MNILHILKSFIYNKKIKKSTFDTSIKIKVIGVTVYKEVTNYYAIKKTYFKIFHRVTLIGKEDYTTNKHFDYDTPMYSKSTPLVSVIVPNYNHAPYLRQRLDCIYNQTYKNIEVILLDDCSTDNSIEILEEYASKYAANTRLLINDTNSGKVFHQWNKGISLAKGEYIWIAESDDYCDLNLLEELVIGLRNQSAMLSFARSVFVKEGKEIWTIEKYLNDLPLSWDKPFLIPAHALVNNAFAIKNVVPNVSSALFRNVGIIPQEITDIWQNMKLCGDWLFYLWLIKGGAVSYTNKVNNYYRIHAESTSLKIQKTIDYYKETFEISSFVAKHYNIDFNIFEKVKQNLLLHYESNKNTFGTAFIEKIYSIDTLKEIANCRKPNIAIACFSLQQGGGEIFPIYLANELKRQGITITFIDFNGENYEEETRKKLNPNIPLIRINDIKYLSYIVASFGFDLIHSHNSTIDLVTSHAIKHNPSCKQIITLHGMYEAIKPSESKNIIYNVTETCSNFVYIAEKNLIPFQFATALNFTKIGNGLPVISTSPIPRKELSIEENAFCLCLVSRALFDKGWLEAIDAVKLANSKSDIPIHLLLIGDGECYNFLQDKHLPPYIHLLGRKENVRDYFAMSDIGFLPSKFKGESFPLVIIESLMSGTPIIASNIGEINEMLTNPETGEKAGITFDLTNGEIPIDQLSDIIVNLSSDPQNYSSIKENVPIVAKKFSIENTAKQYLKIYNKTLS